MTVAPPDEASPAGTALLSLALLAIARGEFGGISVVGGTSEAAEALFGALASLAPDLGEPYRLGRAGGRVDFEPGLDLAATLVAGRRVPTDGLCARVAGRPLLVAGAERWPAEAVARLLAAIDGVPGRTPHPLLLAIDESLGEDEGCGPVLLERLAFRVDLAGVRARDLAVPEGWPERVVEARRQYVVAEAPAPLLEATVAAALALGIRSSRADVLGHTAMRAHAAWRGDRVADEADAAVSVRLVLAHRARQFPAEGTSSAEDDSAEESPQREPSVEPADPAVPPDMAAQDGVPPTGRPERSFERERSLEPGANREGSIDLAEQLVESSLANLPAGLLAQLRSQDPPPPRQGEPAGRRSRTRDARARRGRPIGHAPGDPRHDGPLHLTATLEHAAPWQAVRRRELRSARFPEAVERRIIVLPGDLRVVRFKDHAPSTTIVAVDASGSSALHRMGEAKGAVELLLAEAYVRREEVAVVAFRGARAEVLLAPTRALARARRALAGLPGGGATPLAHGIEVAHDLAVRARRAGQATLLVLLTDGRANVDRTGIAGRHRARQDALASARRLAATGITTLLVDTSPTPARKAEELARAMCARYVPLPHAGARAIAGVVAQARTGRT